MKLPLCCNYCLVERIKKQTTFSHFNDRNVNKSIDQLIYREKIWRLLADATKCCILARTKSLLQYLFYHFYYVVLLLMKNN